MGLDEALAAQAAAKAQQTNPWLNPGNYVLEIVKFFYQSGRKGEFLGANVRIVSSTSNGQIDRQGKPYVPNQAGSVAGILCKISGEYPESGHGRFKAMVMATFNKTEDQLGTPEVYSASVRALVKDGKGAGKKLVAEAWVKPQDKKPSEDFTQINFRPYTETVAVTA